MTRAHAHNPERTTPPESEAWMSELTVQERETLRGWLRNATYRTGDVILRQGDPADAFYILTAGAVKVHRTTPTGQERIYALLRPPQWFGESGLLGYAVRSATVTAMEATSVIILTVYDFERFAAWHPAGALSVLRTIGRRLMQRLHETQLATEDLLSCTSEERVMVTITRLVNEYGQLSNDGMEKRLRLGHEELGQLAGVSRETVSRVLGRLRDKGLLRQGRGYITVRRRGGPKPAGPPFLFEL